MLIAGQTRSQIIALEDLNHGVSFDHHQPQRFERFGEWSDQSDLAPHFNTMVSKHVSYDRMSFEHPFKTFISCSLPMRFRI